MPFCRNFHTVAFLAILPALLFAFIEIRAGEPLGVMPFQTFRKEDKKAGEKLAAQILLSLARTRRYTLVERGQLKKALEEIALSQSGAVSNKEALKIGKQIGARYLILGELQSENKNNENKGERTIYRASARLVKTETGVIVNAASARGTFRQISRSLSLQVRQMLAMYLALENPDSPYSILLKLGKGQSSPVYKIGDTLRLTFRVLKHRKKAPDKVYIQIYSIDSRGAMTMIYPNKFSPAMQIRVGKTYTFPSEEADFEWELVPPTGTESIQAIVTERPIHFFQETKSYKSKAFPEIRGKESPVRYRGIRVRIKKEKLKDWSAERISYTLKK